MHNLKTIMIPSLFVLTITTGLFANNAVACPDGQYEVCTGFCYCVPNSGTVINAAANTVNPLPDTLNVLGAVVQGNVDQLSQSVGGLVIKSSCPSCDVFGQIVMDKKDKGFIEKVVGRGWLLYVGGADPVLILADAATSIAKKYAIRPPEQNPLQPTAAPGREIKTYTSDQALCAVISEQNLVTVGWVNAPTFQDNKTGTNFTFPNVDLVEGDVLIVSSTNECPDVPDGQRRVTNVRLTFDYSNTFPGGPTMMKYFTVGNESK